MALTATATKTTRKFIIDSLSMQLPEIIYIPPVKNIIYVVLDKPKDIGNYFERIVEKLKVEGISMHRMIIFCKTYKNIITIYSYFKQKLGERMTEPPGSPNFVINQLVTRLFRNLQNHQHFVLSLQPLHLAWESTAPMYTMSFIGVCLPMLRCMCRTVQRSLVFVDERSFLKISWL